MSEHAVHFGSFDAELSWRPSDRAVLPSAPTVGRLSGMDQLLVAGCREGDVLVTSEPAEAALVDVLGGAGLDRRRRVAPGSADHTVEERLAEADPDWSTDVAGWSGSVFAVIPGTRRALDRTRLRGAVPAVDVVATVNSKLWSNDLVQEWGLPGSAAVARSPVEVEELAAELDRGACVVKDPYGVSGRGCLRVDTPRVLDTVVRHLSAQTRRGRRVELLVQPFFEVDVDFSSHIVVHESGRIEWLGLQTIDNDAFSYRGSGPAPAGLAAQLGDSYREVVHDVGAALHSAGYRGPASVDGLRAGDGLVVPVLEINARRSMGWLNLQLDAMAADRGLRSSLCSYRMPVRSGSPTEELLGALGTAGLLFDGARPGVLPIAVVVAGDRWRQMFCAVLAGDPEDFRALTAGLSGALRSCDGR